MRDVFRTEVRGFDYAFVLPAHGEGWEGHALVPAEAPAPTAAASTASAPSPRRRASDKQPVYIEIKAKP